MVDFNKRLLKEIVYLRHLKEIGIESDRITYCLEMLRFVRNSELGHSFNEGFVQENEWISENKTLMDNTIKLT